MLGGLNLIGLKRRGLPRANINALRAAFKLIFLDNLGCMGDRARAAKEKWPVLEVAEIADFILAPAKRPICLARRRMTDADE